MELQLTNVYSQNGMRLAIEVFNSPHNFNCSFITLAYRFILEHIDKYPYTLKPTKNQVKERIKSIFYICL